MTLIRKYPLYELSPEQFERLCFDLLTRIYKGYDFGVFGPEKGPDRGIDIVGRKDEEGKHLKIAVEVKHRTSLHPDGLRLSLQRFSEYFSQFDEVIIITSSPITKTHRDFVSLPSLKEKGVNVSILGQDDIFDLLDKNKDIAALYFTEIFEKVKKRKYAEITGILGSILSISGLVITLYTTTITKEEDSTLEKQIGSVESALDGVKNLEKSLTNLKSELEKTSKESVQIKKEYEEALKLKEVTKDQLSQIKKAVSTQSKTEVIINYLLGFLFGIGSSIVGAIVFERIKRMRKLSDEKA